MSVIIGKVSVRVHPDTTDFRHELRVALERIEDMTDLNVNLELDEDAFGKKVAATVKRVEGLTEVNLNATLDSDGLIGEARRAATAAKAAVGDIKADIKAEVNQADLARAIAAFKKHVPEKTAPVSIPSELDNISLAAVRGKFESLQIEANKVKIKAEEDRASLEAAIANFKRLVPDKVPVGVPAELSEAALANVRRKFADLKDDVEDDKIELEAKARTTQARAELARVARTRTVDLLVKVNRASIARVETTLASLSGLRMLDNTMNRLKDMFRNLDKNIPIIGGITEAVMGLSIAILAAASNTFGLARSLAQISGAALALPGIMGGMAIGLGASIAVLKDFGAVLPGLKRDLSTLQTAMSTSFWAVAQKPFEHLINSLLPQFQRGLVTTSILLGKWYGSLANALVGTLDGSLDGMFNNLAASIGIASTANQGLANSIKVLGQHGSEYLPRLAAWYRDVVNGFSDWLSRASDSGKLNEWIELGITNLKELGRVAKHAFDIIAGLGRAAHAAGGTNLTSFAKGLETVSKTVNSASFQKNLTQAFEAAHVAMRRITTESGPAVKAFFSSLPSLLTRGFADAGAAIGSLLDGFFRALNTDRFAKGFLDMLDGLRQGIQSLAPMWAPIGDAFGNLMSLIGSMAKSFGPLIAEFFITLSRVVEAVLPGLTALQVALSSTLLDVIKSLATPIEWLAKAFGALLQAVANPAGLIAIAGALAGLKLSLAGLNLYKFLSEGTGLAKVLTDLGGTSGTIGRLAGALPGLAKGLMLAGGAAVGVAAVAAGLAMLLDKASSAGVATPNIDRLATSLGLVSRSWSDLNKSAGGGRGNWFSDVVQKAFSTGSAADVDSYATALKNMHTWINLSGWDKFAGVGQDAQRLGQAFNTMSAEGKQSKAAVESLDGALAQMLASGNANSIAMAQERFDELVKSSKLSVEDLKNLLPQYTEGLKTLDAAQAIQTETARKQATALGEWSTAVENASGISPVLVDSINEMSRSFIDFNKALDDRGGETKLKDWLGKLERMANDMKAWADNITALATGKGTKSGKALSTPVIEELKKMGTDGAHIVRQLVEASGEDFDRLEEIVRLKTQGAAGVAGSAFNVLAQNVQAELAKLSPEAKAALADLGIVIESEAGQIAVNAQNGFKELPPAVRAELDKLSPEAKSVLTQLGVDMSTNAGTAATSAVNGFKDNLSPLTGEVTGAFSAAALAISVSKPQFDTQGRQLGGAAFDGFKEFVNKLPAEATSAGTSAASALGATNGMFDIAGRGLGQSAASGLQGQTGLAQAAGRAVGLGGWAGVDGTTPYFQGSGVQAGSSYATGVTMRQTAARSAGSGLGSAAKSGASGFSLSGEGANLASSFASGISSMVGRVAETARSLAQSAVSTVKSILQINSPSKVATQLGSWFGQGLVDGVVDQKKPLERAVESLADVMAGVEIVDPLADQTLAGSQINRNAVKAAQASRPVQAEIAGGDTYNITVPQMVDTAEKLASEIRFVQRHASRGGIRNRS